ncbi:chondroitin sulfate proteoglycan 5-like, partial [Corapipo altera]|uniref:chondroitin sulfate proteoglycan 5-like n=1 Tax=Corapipo altera TaxID=415028 RepID=UPI000FD64C14
GNHQSWGFLRGSSLWPLGEAQGFRVQPPPNSLLGCWCVQGRAASERPPQNTSDAEGRAWEGSLESSPPKWDLASGDPPGGPSNSTSPEGAAAGPQLEPPGGGTATTDPSTMPEGCPGCSGEGDASAVPPGAVTWPGAEGTVPVALGSPEEPGSGERPTAASLPSPGGIGGLPAAPPSPPGPQLATDSAESELLPAAGGSAAPQSPVLGEPSPVPAAGGHSGGPPELWAAPSSPAPAQGARGWTDLTWLQEPITAATGPAKPPPARAGSDIIDVDYYDLFEGGDGL